MVRKMAVVGMVVVLGFLFGFSSYSYAEEKGLIAYWNFDEGSGEVAYDKSGNKNDGKIYGAEYVKRGEGYALQFDGKDDYIDCGNKESLNFGTEGFSIEMWIKSKVSGGKFISRYYDEDNRWYIMPKWGSPGEGTLHFYVRVGGKTGGVSGATNIWDEYWHHVVIVVPKGEEATIHNYLDTVVDGRAPVTLENWDNAGNFHIGNWCFKGGEYYWNGTIDEVTIYKRALTEEEIKEHYEAWWSNAPEEEEKSTF